MLNRNHAFELIEVISAADRGRKFEPSSPAIERSLPMRHVRSMRVFSIDARSELIGDEPHLATSSSHAVRDRQARIGAAQPEQTQTSFD